MEWSGGATHWLFDIYSGVLQGCPLSGLLFVCCMDPITRALAARITGRGSATACADDLAVALSSIAHLPRVHAVVDLAARAACLCLHFDPN